MSRSTIACALAALSCANAEARRTVDNANSQPSVAVSADTLIDFNALNSAIRDGRIAQPEALRQLRAALPQLRRRYFMGGGRKWTAADWEFPLQGYASAAIGGAKGNGYVARGYDYFDGNRHGGHPAHDIFINDRNQDGLDDATKKPVNVLSMTGGLIVATETTWEAASALRGGKYIWIYDPSSNSFFYYAHNGNVLGRVLDIVSPGDVIATVGRTGLNAFKTRSPTHLHIMRLWLDDESYPRPVNCFDELLAAARKSRRR